MYKYVIIVEKADKNYSAYCPDLPGCVATGKTVEETADRMKEAIEFHLEGMKKDGLSIPKPTTLATAVDIAIEG
ncbi:MAG: type II toxin-antitoxin system HicB family antitoxin [Candidatus Hydrothermarchaeales archaeon]